MDPDLFIFASTINDGKAGTTKAAYKANILSVISAAPNADIVLVVAYPSSHASSTNGLIDSYRDALQEIAASMSNVRVIDARNVFGCSNAQATTYGYVFDADHANAAGYLAQANYIYQTLLPAGL
jgi:lysophospholipase L1-like esterase